MANTTTIDLPLTGLVTKKEWGDAAYVYAPNTDQFYITQEPHKTLEQVAIRKFKAKVTEIEGIVNIILSTEFARTYLWERKAAISKIVYGDKIAIVVFAEEKKAN